MFEDLDELYQEVIREHSTHPRNFRALPSPARAVDGHNPLCGDQVRLYVAMDGDRVADVGFTGQGCAISRASASMMTEAIKGKSREEIRRAFDSFHEMVTTGRSDAKGLGKLTVFSGVHKYPVRVKCAMLAWHAAIAAMEGGVAEVSTEQAEEAPSPKGGEA
ncbi:MAG TPA: SUF system NifU family Fe-S cluster assembly protein [Verrucomicrobiae bacterium]|nr:SUF system NifU family Fe-S cluster assembly protein [Verrucomicrobiae bacterium]